MAGLLEVGLTGGIACGRTTVARFLEGPTTLVIDADSVAHALIAPGGAAAAAVAEAFGQGVVNAGGGIDRRALGAIVFADPQARRRLEAILHPMILEEARARARAFAAEHPDGIAIVDAALMVETGTYRRYHRIVVAHCPPEVQRARLMGRDRLSRAQAEARIAAQAPLSEKIAVADYLVDTGGTMEQTREKALHVAAMLAEDQADLPDLRPRWRGGAAC